MSGETTGYRNWSFPCCISIFSKPLLFVRFKQFRGSEREREREERFERAQQWMLLIFLFPRYWCVWIVPPIGLERFAPFPLLIEPINASTLALSESAIVNERERERGGGEREGERDRQRERERQRQRQRHRETEKDRDRDRERQRQRKTETERDRDRERQKQRNKDKQREKEIDKTRTPTRKL